MAYGDNTLNADHTWSFDNTLSDPVGLVTLTNVGTTFTPLPITRDSEYSLLTNSREGVVSCASQADTGLTATDLYTIGGWFMVSQIQGPPVLIYGQGGSVGIALFLWSGNNIMCQVKTASRTIQIYSNIALTNNRAYHFMVKLEGSSFDNEVSFYIDGIKQTANLDGVDINGTVLGHSTGHAWGDNEAVTNIKVGSATVICKASVNGYYSQWWTWEGTKARLSKENITDTIVAPGAIPGVTISSDTQANMQTELDSIQNSLRGDTALAIMVEEVAGGGDLNLLANNITFNERVSIDVYYEGSGTLYWTNQNSSNASKGTSNVVFINPAQVTLTDLADFTEVRVYESGTQNEIAGIEDTSGGSFSFTTGYSVIDINILSLEYLNQALENIQALGDISIGVSQTTDRQYKN